MGVLGFLLLGISLLVLLACSGESWEGRSEGEVSVDVLVGQLVELGLVGFQVLDEVDEVLGLLELAQVFSINHISKLIFNLNHQFNSVQTVKTMIFEVRFEGNRCFLGGSEVVPDDAEHVLLHLVPALQH
jgi:hypothetical protein